MLFSADQKVHIDGQGTLTESLQTVDSTVPSERIRTLGLCDIQLNGFAGIDFNNPDLNPEDFHRSMQALLRTGVTNVLPTLITADKDDLYRNFEALERARVFSPTKGWSPLLFLPIQAFTTETVNELLIVAANTKKGMSLHSEISSHAM